ncbi:MAG TPA: hypothetical protein VHU13_08860 [Solirubrobacteraceae bacterium]|nr:hypothetical protein [Solirubrobacteraceae bacterium]
MARELAREQAIGERPVPGVGGDLAIMVGAFVLASAIAAALGAANLGAALAFGQIAFAIATVFVMVKR